ncbi:MAG TPA: hypothetical protein VF173_12870 [Thermoanaerobaculia bacterium]|nr:hypothetical protein [Thermoanaerobaculia bacterium]
MIRTSRLIALSLALAASLAAFVAPPASSSCLVVCDGGFCGAHLVSGTDVCTHKHVCTTICAE